MTLTSDCVAVQNVSSVQCYLWDISLLFAQRRDNIELAQQILHLQVANADGLKQRPSSSCLCINVHHCLALAASESSDCS